MRFQQQFEASQYSAWKQWYLPYESLKVLIKISFPSAGELRRSNTNRRHIGSDDISTLVAHRRLARQQRQSLSQDSNGVSLARRPGTLTISTTPHSILTKFPLRSSQSDPDNIKPPPQRMMSIENIIIPSEQISIIPVTQHIAVSPTTSLLLGPIKKYGTQENSLRPIRKVTIDPIPIHIEEPPHKDSYDKEDKEKEFVRHDTPHPYQQYDYDDDDDTEHLGFSTGDKIQKFLHALRKELLRIDPFYRRIEAELMASLHALHQQMFHMRSDGMGHEAIRNAFIHLLKKATLAVNFISLNQAAVERLLYHLEQRTHIPGLASQYSYIIRESYMGHSTHIEQVLIPSTYKAFADAFEHGDVEAAKVVLLSKMTDSEQNSKDNFVLGLKCGVIFMLIMWILLLLTRPVPNVHVAHMMRFGHVYRVMGCGIIMIWLWGCVVAVWERWRISYVFIFEMNPRSRLTEFQIFTEAANLSIVYLVNSLLLVSHHQRSSDHTISSLIYPLSLFIYLICKCFIPLPIFSHISSRTYIFHSLCNIIIAPFGRVRFRDCFIADILTSCVKIFVDLEYSICLYSAGIWLRDGAQKDECLNISRYLVPLICALPLYWRFQQCMRRYWDTRLRYPHMWNALKYLVAHSIVIVSTFHPLLTDSQAAWQNYRVFWLLCLIVSTLYSFWWDCALDWGLFNRDHMMLREQLVFRSKWIYYYAIISNFFLRFLWCLTIIPFSFEQEPTNTTTAYLLSYDYVILPVLMIGELFRRFQWGIFRVEWEHLANHRSIAIRNFMFINDDIQQENKKQSQPGYGVMCEVIFMIFLLIVIAIIGAVFI